MTAATFPPAGVNRIDSLTGLRFVAAAVVLLEHFPEVIPGLGVADAAQGGAGVSLFFVLSGFVLTYRYGDRFAAGVRPRRYVLARVGRIVPLHLLALAIVVPLVFVLNSPQDEYASPQLAMAIVVNAVLLQSWIPAQVFHIWNGPAWSISVEAFFYVTFPLAVAMVVWPLLRRRWLGRAIVAVAALQVVTFVAVSIAVGELLLRRSGDASGAQLIVGRVGYFPPLRLGEFLIGCLLAAAFRPEHRAEGPGWWARLENRRFRSAVLAIAVVAAVAIQFSPRCLADACGADAVTGAGMVDLRLFAVYLPVSVAAVAAIAWGASWATRPLASRPMVALGEASYAIYILQWAAWLVINDGPGRPSQLQAVLAVIATVAAALVVHRWVEDPARRYITRRRGSAEP